MRRRQILLSTLPLAGFVVGCAPSSPGAPGTAPPPSVRTFIGGFLAPALPTMPMPGLLPRPGVAAGMFVKLQAPTALALRGFDLLVADMATGRLWRADLIMQTLAPVAGAPVGLDTVLLLGADRSAWVLDARARQVLRFAVDGRLLQTWRSGAGSTVGMAVMDGGASLVVADAAWGQWLELRSGGAVALPVQPRRSDGTRIGAIDAVAMGSTHLFVLDRAAGLVYRAQRDGEVIETLGAGTLVQPSTLVVDRFDRAWVLDGQGRSLTLLASGRAPEVRTAAELGVQLIGGVAVDDRSLAVSDRLVGQVLIHPLPEPVKAPLALQRPAVRVGADMGTFAPGASHPLSLPGLPT